MDTNVNILDRDANKQSFLSLMTSVFPTENVKHDYFGALTDIFSAYVLGTIEKGDLDRILKEYLSHLIVTNKIQKDDFLFFGYFLSQFVSHPQDVFSQDILEITLDLSTIIHAYYTYESPNLPMDKRASTLSTILYLY